MNRYAILALLALAGCGTPPATTGEPGEIATLATSPALSGTTRVVDASQQLLLVNDQPITRRDLFLTFNPQPLLGLEANEYPPQQQDVLMERAVFRALVLAEARKKGYLDPEEVDPESWWTYQDYLRDSLLIKAYLEREVVKEIEVTPEEVAEYYATNQDMFERPESRRTSHILVCHTESQGCAGERTPEEALAYANELRDRALAGEDFAALAMEGSDGPSGPNGGDLGENSRGVFVPTFEAAAWSLGEGEVSEVVTTQFGYHVIKVTAITEISHIPLESIAPLIKEQVRRERAEERVRAHVQALRASAVLAAPAPPEAPTEADDSGE